MEKNCFRINYEMGGGGSILMVEVVLYYFPITVALNVKAKYWSYCLTYNFKKRHHAIDKKGMSKVHVHIEHFLEFSWWFFLG